MGGKAGRLAWPGETGDVTMKPNGAKGAMPLVFQCQCLGRSWDAGGIWGRIGFGPAARNGQTRGLTLE